MIVDKSTRCVELRSGQVLDVSRIVMLDKVFKNGTKSTLDILCTADSSLMLHGTEAELQSDYEVIKRAMLGIEPKLAEPSVTTMPPEYSSMIPVWPDCEIRADDGHREYALNQVTMLPDVGTCLEGEMRTDKPYNYSIGYMVHTKVDDAARLRQDMNRIQRTGASNHDRTQTVHPDGSRRQRR